MYKRTRLCCFALGLLAAAGNAAGQECAHWSNVVSPKRLDGAAMVYDSARGVTLLFGGRSQSSGSYYGLDETWEWDGVNWMQRMPQTRPWGRYGHAMAYDSDRGVTVLFGGSDFGSPLGDTWEWDGTT